MDFPASKGAELVRRAKCWYFLVADYAFGTDARDRLKVILDAHGGSVAGMDLHPLGTSDFSPFMVKARATDADAFPTARKRPRSSAARKFLRVTATRRCA
jgi:ABC-type branched-subunit amino acid transport system substrate-binding protein